MARYLKSAMAVAVAVMATHAMAQVTLYEGEGFRGRSFVAERDIRNLDRFGFNDRASSVVVRGERSSRWEVCEHERFEGRCVVLRPGDYPSIAAMGLGNRISSVREIPPAERVADGRYAPMPRMYEPVATTDYRRRPDERLYEANVIAVRAVVGPPQQRCWIERERVGTAPGPNVGGAVAGALIGGILGHQIGGGSGRDAATALGVVGGAAVGANAGGGGSGQAITQDVRRCDQPVAQAPEYYDVSYTFRGLEHRVQMAAPPGSVILVNDNGEPRG